jgi:hypothetical protein
MVGVRYKRALFPGFSDTVEYLIDCPATRGVGDPSGKDARTESGPVELEAPATPGRYHITAILQYRKTDQYLINFLLGEDSGLSAPVVELTRAEATVEVKPL